MVRNQTNIFLNQYLLGAELVFEKPGITWWSFSYDYLVTELVKGGLFRIMTFGSFVCKAFDSNHKSDFFGRGFSGSPNKEYNVDTYLTQIETVVEKLSLTKFTLIG